MACFTCHKSGHSVISLTDQSRAILELRSLRYPMENYNLLENERKALLKKIEKPPRNLYVSPSRTTSPILLPHHPDSSPGLKPFLEDEKLGKQSENYVNIVPPLETSCSA